MNAYVLEGPAVAGNVFGFYGHAVPEGRFAVVADGEYSNGGCGPSSVDGTLYRTRERAEQACREYNAERAGA